MRVLCQRFTSEGASNRADALPEAVGKPKGKGGQRSLRRNQRLVPCRHKSQSASRREAAADGCERVFCLYTWEITILKRLHKVGGACEDVF